MASFLEYSNATHSNIIPKEQFEELIHEVFDVIAGALSKSLGPMGSTTMIMEGPYTDVTKDGFTIFKNLRFRNLYKKMVYDLIKDPCSRLNSTVGDGTTSAIVMTQALFNAYKEADLTLRQLYRMPRTFNDVWNNTIAEICDLLHSYARPISTSIEIYDVAYVASNGNTEIAANIASIYSRSNHPAIQMKDSPTNKSYVEKVRGYPLPASLVDQAYCTNEDLSCSIKNAAVLIMDHKLDAQTFDVLREINEVMMAKNQKLIVVLPTVDALLANTTLKRYANAEYQKLKGFNLYIVQYPYHKMAEFQLDDLAAVLGCRVFDQKTFRDDVISNVESMSPPKIFDFVEKEIMPNYLGSCDIAHMSVYAGCTFEVANPAERYTQQLDSAKKNLSAMLASTDSKAKSYAINIANAESRISRLKMENYVYYIGANTTLQHKMLYTTIEDTIKATSSAAKFGVVPGCQISIIRACNELQQGLDPDGDTGVVRLTFEILNLIRNATVSMYSRVLCGPRGNGIWPVVPNIDKITEADNLKAAILETLQNIINESIDQRKVFDLETLVHSDKIITSAETDVEILLASSDLIKLLISGNQCVYLDASLEGVQDSTIEM